MVTKIGYGICLYPIVQDNSRKMQITQEALRLVQAIAILLRLVQCIVTNNKKNFQLIAKRCQSLVTAELLYSEPAYS